MSETKALRWVKASERLPERLVDKEYHARVKAFLSDDPKDVIIKAMPESVDFWIMNGYAFYCTAPADRIIEWLEGNAPNPGDMPSRPVDKTVDEMAAAAREGKDLHYGGYREVAQALQSQISSITEALRIARKNVDGLIHWWTEVKAERDAALKDSEEKQVSINSHYERFNEYIEAANHAREGQEKALKLLDQALKERDVAIESSRTWEKETSTLGAILEGKNLEIAQLKEEVGEYRNMINHLVFEGNVITRGTARRVKQHLAKYKKEEQK